MKILLAWGISVHNEVIVKIIAIGEREGLRVYKQAVKRLRDEE